MDVPLRYFTCVIRTPQAMFPASLSEIAGVAESVFESEYVCVAVIMDMQKRLSHGFWQTFFWVTFFSGSRYLAPHSKHYGPGKQGLQTCIWSYPAKAQRAGAETENCQLGWANPGEIISCVP